MQHLEVIAVMRTENFKKKLSDNNAVLEPVILNNHHALRTIDNFAILFTRNSKLAEKNTAPNKEACPPPPPLRPRDSGAHMVKRIIEDGAVGRGSTS